MSETIYDYGAVILLNLGDTDSLLSEKCRAMRKMHMNTVVVWPPVFYRRGKPDVSVQKKMLDQAEKHKLRVIVELTGQVSNLEYLPDCRWKKEYAVVDPDGKAIPDQNGLGELNYNHPEVKKALKDFFRFTVESLKDHPALYGWDIWNETHFKSFDPWTIRLFQKNMKEKYRTVDALNAAWHKSYTAFSQIRPDPVTWASMTPELDWEAFRTKNLADILGEWRKTVHHLDPGHFIIADNVMSNTVWSESDRGTDDWMIARNTDRYGLSFYPKTGGRLLKENTPAIRRLTFAGADSAAGPEGFTISEMQSHFYSEIFTPERVLPEEILDWNLEALFSHARGCIFWKLSPFVSGFQCGGRGLLLANGASSPRAEAASLFGKFLESEHDIRRLTPFRQAALLYDIRSTRTVKALNTRIHSLIGNDQAVRALCRTAELIWQKNIPFSIVTPDQIPSMRETLLFAPYQLTMDETLAKNLECFLESGGTLIVEPPFGDLTPEGTLHTDLPGGPFRKTLNLRFLDRIESNGQEFQVLKPGKDVQTRLADSAGFPLLYERAVGRGKVIYLPGGLNENIWNELNIVSVLPVSGTHAEMASGAEHDYLFIAGENLGKSVKINLPDAKIVFGSGLIRKKGKSLEICNPEHLVLRLPKGEQK